VQSCASNVRVICIVDEFAHERGLAPQSRRHCVIALCVLRHSFEQARPNVKAVGAATGAFAVPVPTGQTLCHFTVVNGAEIFRQ